MLSLIIISIIGVIQNPVERNLTNHAGHDRYASYSPDGGKILFESDRGGNWDIYLMNSDGSQVLQLTTDATDERRPSWHPNGKQIVFESDRSGQYKLYRLSIANGKIGRLNVPELPGTPIFARFAPNGALAYSMKYEGDSSKLVVLDPLGQLQIELLDDGFRSFYPTWSSDSNKLLFFSRHDTENDDDEIYQINIDGSELKRLTHWPTHNFCPSWSPNDSLIAYAQSMDGSRPEIFVMHSDGRYPKRLTNNQDGETLPQWSPDGSKLLITAYRGDNFEIVELTIPE